MVSHPPHSTPTNPHRFALMGWQVWQATGNNEPDVSVIPAMLRRRLSPMGRAALSVVIPLLDTWGDMPIVYVSRHGELNRTLGLLRDLAIDEPLSPTAFSLSVHNATAGLLSIHRGLTHAITAISGGAQDVVPALLECLGQCTPQQPQVLCVFCDEAIPEIYHTHEQPHPLHAVAFVITLAPAVTAPHWALSLTTSPVAPPAVKPQALQLAQALAQSQPLTLASNGNIWHLQPIGGANGQA